MEPFWIRVDGGTLRQGDFLPGCIVPILPKVLVPDGNMSASARSNDLIIVTQSCDIEQGRVRRIALLAISSLPEFEASNPSFAKKGRWNEVLKGRAEGLHLLASPTNPEDSRQALVVDFREIYSLPIDYLTDHAARLGRPRWRLKSPFLEHFSQAFARFFMRVGLPSTIPEFR
jgi:hypothetical protein